MSLQSLLGAHSLVAAGISVGDIATLYTVGRRVGNWLTAESGDQDFLAILEEDEMSILKRRGVIDIIRFKKRWGQTLRLFQNGRPQRLDGQAVEKLLDSASRFTVIMTCFVAALDVFASESTVRLVLKVFLQRLIPTTEINEDMIVSQIGTRINAWRSAAAVRDLHTACRRVFESLLHQDLIVPGHMPKEEANEVANFLHWVVAGESEELHTASSDVAGIAHCLMHLSFEILSVENFGTPADAPTSCRLVYSAASNLPGEEQIAKHRSLSRRGLSTTVSLTQPEETFSTFPISRHVANKCRVAWKEGIRVASYVKLSPDKASGENLKYKFTTQHIEPSESHLRESHPRESYPRGCHELVADLLAPKHSFLPQLYSGLASVLEEVPHETLDQIEKLLRPRNLRGAWGQYLPADSSIEDAFHVLQAFFMGYYYALFMQIVDTSMLDMRSVSGSWGYRSFDFLYKMRDFMCSNSLYRSDILSILAILFTNLGDDFEMLIETYKRKEKHELSAGFIAKRTILINSLVKDCITYPTAHSPEGHVVFGTSTKFPIWRINQSPIVGNLHLTAAPEGFTRNIEVDWDDKSEKSLLCIRFKGRRVGVVDPIAADRCFVDSWKTFSPAPLTMYNGSYYECTWEDIVKRGKLPIPYNPDAGITIIVQSSGSPCLRYAATAWYSDWHYGVVMGSDIPAGIRPLQDGRIGFALVT